MRSIKATFLIMLVVPLAYSPLLFADAVMINPLPFSSTTGVTVETTMLEKESIVSNEYRWFINGEEVFFEKSAHLPGHLFKRGDVVKVEVTPVTYTGERLASVITRPFEASNAPPAITSEPPEAFTEAGFRYQVIAVDPDEDVLTFKLENAPDNMQIDSSSGLIEWNVESIEDGTFPVKIIVDDGHGGQTEQSFELQLAYEEVQSP